MECCNNFTPIVKIDQKAPSFNLPYYDPKSDSDGHISLDDIK
jgi:hypothetical protein